MADKEEKVEQEENAEKETIELDDPDGKSGSKKKIIIVAVAILLLVGIAIGATLFFLGSNEDELVEEGAEGESEIVVDSEAEESAGGVESAALYYPLKPPYIVNIDARGRRRYLQAELTLLAREDDVIAAIEMHKPSFDHTINVLLSGHVFEDIQTAEGKELLRLELTKSLQELLTEEIGKPGIEQVLFTNFVMQ